MTEMRIIRVAVADDGPVILHALVRCLRAQPDVEVMAEAEDAAELVEQSTHWDILNAIRDQARWRWKLLG